ncbi:MAG: hypothetical protein AUJ01_15365 [Acidobacteria bacterium 13_1_40CM_3_65_5]|nr:MAG: hypothetical protein AUJ01_15365 [Acidobacteria bacterium 13_1_40CM_3_65_5]
MTANELKLDYFHIYDVGNKSAAGDVLLRGQFDVRRQKMRLALLDYFANPVSKNAEPIYDPHAHLTWYVGVQPSEPVRAVRTRTRRREFPTVCVKRHAAVTRSRRTSSMSASGGGQAAAAPGEATVAVYHESEGAYRASTYAHARTPD